MMTVVYAEAYLLSFGKVNVGNLQGIGKQVFAWSYSLTLKLKMFGIQKLNFSRT